VIENFPTKKYSIIYADPPWPYGKWGKASDSDTARKKFPNGQWNKQFDMGYAAMSLKEIANMPVATLSKEDCELYLWTTQKYLPHAFTVISAWGFKYCQTLTWCKIPRGTGQGGVFCPTTEFLLLARKGKAPKTTRIDTTWWKVTRTNKHSKKPAFFRELIDSIYGDVDKIELFARERFEGWDCWGNEV
jgi:N6-adenosine-specific RNA methylase IME4